MISRYSGQLPPHWEKYSKVYNALGDPQRQKIMLLFEPGERLTIKQIAEAFPFSRTATVHHLSVMIDAGVLKKERQGKEVRLWIDREHVIATVRRVCDYIEHNA